METKYAIKVSSGNCTCHKKENDINPELYFCKKSGSLHCLPEYQVRGINTKIGEGSGKVCSPYDGVGNHGNERIL